MLGSILAGNGAPPARISDDLLIGDDLTVGDLIAAVRATFTEGITAASFNGVQVLSGAAVPSAGAGVAHVQPSLYFRSGTVEVYWANGAGDTAWALVIQATGVVAAATTSVDGAAAKAETDAATSAPTASTIVRRTASGYLKDRADSSEVMFPGYRRMIAELGYTALDGYWRMQEASSHLKHRGNASGQTLNVQGTPTFDYMTNGFRGIYMDTAGDAFGYQQNVLDFADNSVHLFVAFARISDPGTTQSLIGRYANGATRATDDRWLVLDINSAADLATVRIEDGTNGMLPSVSATPIAVGGIYLLQCVLRKDLDTLDARLSKWGEGLVSAEISNDVTGYGDLTGGTTPEFAVGHGLAWGDGINFLGAGVRIGAECEAAGKMAALAQITGFEA